MNDVVRPKARPSVTIKPSDFELIERVVYDEAVGEGIEGRNAVRGSIFNRLMSSRFPGTVREVLEQSGQFEGVPRPEDGGLDAMEAPEDYMEYGIPELEDYIAQGVDASDGRTFFQNAEITKQRGTEFSGADPMQIGNHTFTRSYNDQEPVLDTAFSHNINLVSENDGNFSKGGLMARYGQKNEDDPEMEDRREEEPVEANCGGYMDSMGLMGPDMLIDTMYVGEDPESGNPIPVGSSAENVRDDIPAMISEGEYVLPADVVKWYGLKGILDFQNEAKMGLMSMAADDLIQHIDMDEEPEEESEETPEGNEVEEAEVTVEEEVMESVEYDEEDEEFYPSKPGQNAFKNKVKFAFIK